MLAKEQNKIIRQKLDHLVSVPEGMKYNSALLWDKLELSLHQNNSRKTKI